MPGKSSVTKVTLAVSVVASEVGAAGVDDTSLPVSTLLVSTAEPHPTRAKLQDITKQRFQFIVCSKKK